MNLFNIFGEKKSIQELKMNFPPPPPLSKHERIEATVNELNLICLEIKKRSDEHIELSDLLKIAAMVQNSLEIKQNREVFF